jgi:D-aspartate ligase
VTARSRLRNEGAAPSVVADREPSSPEAALDRSMLTARPVAVFDNYWAPTLSFARSLGKRGVPLHFYGAGAGGWSRYSSARRSCPPVDDAARFLPWLEARLRSGEIGRVAPTTDLIAFYTAMLREAFPPEVRRSIAPLSEIETCLIKTRFAAACAEVDQPSPSLAAPQHTEHALTVAATLGYPLIVKPKSHLVVGAAERGCLVRNAKELHRAFARYPVAVGQEILAERYPELRWPLLQRYIASARDRVYSVSGVKDADSGIVTASVSYKGEQWPPDIGISTRQVSCADESILKRGLASVDAMLSCGIFELELLAEGDTLLAIDLNPRAFGFIELDISLGHDIPWLWFRTTVAAVPPQPATLTPAPIECRMTIPYYITRGARWLSMSAPARGVVPPPAAEGRVISMHGNWTDPVPTLISYLKFLRHARSLIRNVAAACRLDA